MSDNRQDLERYLDAFRTEAWDVVKALQHDDYTCVFPQTGELISGSDNAIAAFTAYPGGSPVFDLHEIHGDRQEVHVATELPFGMPIVTVSGGGDTFVTEGRADYPDGESAFLVDIVEFRDGKIIKETIYHGTHLEAPEWRKPYAEPLSPRR